MLLRGDKMDKEAIIEYLQSSMNFYSKELQEPQLDYYRGVCTGSIQVCRNILDRLGAEDD